MSGPSAHQLAAEADRLLDFAAGARLPGGGFGYLDDRGRPLPDRPVETWITARMTYVFALAALQGRPGGSELADHGVAALATMLRDRDHGGWHPGVPNPDDEKRAYDHAFVVLATATATAAGRPGAAELLADALDVVDRRFWRADDGLAIDVWDRSWTSLEPYRGANANMHLTEAYLAAAHVTGEREWRRRALGIAERLIHGHARAAAWRLPEHFDEQWRPMLDYNRAEPAHPFRPYGATVGHWLEWARLLAHLHLALAADGEDGEQPPDWLLADAGALFDAAVREGWAVDGADGFVYTVGWDGRPVVRTRMHWVLAEAISAAAVLHGVTGEKSYAEWLGRWWAYAQSHLLDLDAGSWRHELDPANRPSATVWPGKPDVYHAYQAVLFGQLLSSLPPASTLIRALSQGPAGAWEQSR